MPYWCGRAAPTPGADRKSRERTRSARPARPAAENWRRIGRGRRHPSTNGGEQAVREQPDQQLQQVMALGVQGRKLAVGYPQVPRHCEHADECRTHGAIVPVDLGQDFDGAAGNGQDADDLSGLESLVGAGQDSGVGQTEVPGRAFGGGVEPSGVTFRQAGLADRQGLPFPDRLPIPVGERHHGETIPRRQHPPAIRTDLSRVGRRLPC